MKVLRNIAANYLGRSYSIAANYLFIPFYVNILGVEAYGVIAFYAILLTLTSLADIGLSATFTRQAAREEDKRRLLNLLATIERILYLAIGAIAMIFFVGAEIIAQYWLNSAGNLDSETIVWSCRIMALMLVPQLGISLYSAGLLGLQKQVLANLIQSLFITLRSGLVILLILWWPDLPMFFAWQLLITLIFAFVTRGAIIKAMGYPILTLGRFDYSMLKANMAFAGGMMWISSIAAINTQIDKMFVSKLFPLTEFGYYTLASTLAQIPIALVTPIAVAFYPFITELVAKGHVEKQYKSFETYGQWIVLLGAIGSFGIFFFAPEILALWLQNKNLPPNVAEITRLLAIGGLFLSFTTPLYYLALAHGQSRTIALLVTTTLVISVPFTILAVHLWGLLGVTYPWIFLNCSNFLLMIMFVARYHLGDHYSLVIIRTLTFPMIFSFFPILGSKYLSMFIQAPSTVTLIIFGVAAMLSILLFVLVFHGRVMLIRRY